MRNTSCAARTLLAAALLVPCAAALAQQSQQSQTVYRWVDRDGHVHYGDDSSQVPGAKPVNPNLFNSAEAPSAERKTDVDKQADCKRRSDEYLRYVNATGFTETDALGNSRSYSPEEMDKLREHKRQDLADHCGADAPAAATPSVTPAAQAAPKS